MSEHIVKSFHDQLEALSTGIVQMGGMCETQLANSIDAIVRRDMALAEQTVALDARVDQLELQIEQQAMRLLALRQPLAIDLRETLAALKISSDLERIGDLAKNVAKRTLAVSRDAPDQHLTQALARMGRQALAQLKNVLDAYAQRDANAAVTVWKRDGEIDELYNSLFRELLTYMMEDPRKIGPSTHLLFIAKNFERIGDHATNIAEIVHYVVTGAKMGEARPKSDITSSTSIGPHDKP
ncbi:MAG: phosphate signaling complex protein PhoU [Alphaproteobacteria bacterium]|nr:phosphate signaling complex protein PhoU [Alphaproteobacteria bacterium]